MNAFFNSQFNYCPLIWMCHSSKNSNKINRLYARCLWIIYNDNRPSFNALLEKVGSASIHERNIKILATKMFRVSKILAPPPMHDSLSIIYCTILCFLGPMLSHSIKILKVYCFRTKNLGYITGYLQRYTWFKQFWSSFKEMETFKLPLQSKVYNVNVGFV